MVDLALAKEHCRIDTDADDTVLQQYIDAAAAWVENYTGIALEVQTFTQTFDCWPIQLNRSPVTSLTSVSTLAGPVPGARLVNGRVYPAEGTSWPSLSSPDQITVIYEAGLTSVPADLVSAQLLLIGHWYEHREAASEQPAQEIALAVEALCRPHRPQLV